MSFGKGSRKSTFGLWRKRCQQGEDTIGKTFCGDFFFFFFEGQTNTFSFISINKVLIQRGCLVCVFKQLFSVFKQYFTYFYTLFHPHVFPQMFSNNNF